MELLYLHINKFNNFIINQDVTFTNNFNISFNDGILKVESCKNNIKNLYKQNIKNITVFNGKNGTGKTTVLDILGMNRDDRLKQSFDSDNNSILDEYFILYHISDNIFGLESTGEIMFDGIIKNCIVKTESKNYNKSKIAIGVIFEYDGKIFKDLGEYFFSSDGKSCISEYIQVIYCNDLNSYNKRINYSNKAIYEKDDNYLAKRLYFANGNWSYYYKACKTIEEFDIEFTNKKVELIIKYNIDYRSSFIWDDNLKEYESKIKEIEKLLPIYKRKVMLVKDNSITECKSVQNNKYKFILDLYSRYILNFFINGIVNEKNMKITRENDSAEFSVDTIIKWLECYDFTSLNGFLGDCYDNYFELEVLRKIITRLNPKNKVENFDECLKTLKVIGRYVNSRYSLRQNNDKNAYLESMDEMIAYLQDINSKYFYSKEIRIPFRKDKVQSTNIDQENILAFLNRYWFYFTNQDDIENNVQDVFKIEFANLSEGEMQIIKIISKVMYAKEKAYDEGLVILLLDEPDRSLHPEWCRKFVDTLVNVLEQSDYDVQVVITTHSPYIVSDIFPENVFRFRFDKDNNLKIEKLSNIDKACSFGANIYDLLKNNFFLENTIGEFATKKIRGIIGEIDELSKEKFHDEKDDIEYFINNIGEPIIKKAILDRYNKKIKKFKKLKLNNYSCNEILESISNEEERMRVKKILEERMKFLD
ncbi:AAA family ATPase [Clostridium gasigenes]|uniref:AAA domain-containing protein, putative AbiEii toxin, Type IV TA system n=1 Tax=Clostridium gasigenes TaxID=94869 RepID=A0A1H0VLM9_9CLOT|nr:AAA family ATPase [Clostridium gasigenes]MBU3106972.1 ATP-binding protein [Clostridium gasigenes]SDP79234.1 AAA domain-containing protein, putative AbiEii toxin, Type IV TA system [Clostridium gasigenes]